MIYIGKNSKNLPKPAHIQKNMPKESSILSSGIFVQLYLVLLFLFCKPENDSSRLRTIHPLGL